MNVAKQIPKFARVMKNVPIYMAFFGIVCAIIFASRADQQPVDLHSFRQSQTALSAFWFNWENILVSFFNYKTPIFGDPYIVPFEFPIYQSIVSAFSNVLAIPVHFSGRLVSLTFFLLTLLPFASLSKGLGLGRRFFFITSIFWLCSPLYLYWSRTVMIESTSVFFGFCFLAAVERAVASWQWHWWLSALVTSLACALVKVTTYPAFGLAALGILALRTGPVGFRQLKDKEKLLRILYPLVGIACIGLVTVAANLAWTLHADSIKAQNEFAQFLTSKNLKSWTFGTVAQKLDIESWIGLFNRCIPELIGSYWVLLLFLISGFFLRVKNFPLLVALIVLFLLPLLVFTNLHIVHNYYQYANGFWLIFALGLLVSEMSKRVNVLVSGAVISFVLFSQIVSYHKLYFPWLSVQTSSAKQLGKFLLQASYPDESVIVVGDSYSPEVAYFSQRHAFYVSNTLPDEILENILKSFRENPSRYLGPYPPSWLVVNHPHLDKYYSDSKRQIINAFLDRSRDFSALNDGMTLATYSVFKVCGSNSDNLHLEDLDIDGIPENVQRYVQVDKPSLDLKTTEILFKRIKSVKLGNTFDVELKDRGILMIPGSPTEVVFDIEDLAGPIELIAIIDELPPAALEDRENGRVEIEIFMDGISLGRRPVDRITNQKFKIDHSHGKELKAIVTCKNFGAWDHFYLGVAK